MDIEVHKKIPHSNIHFVVDVMGTSFLFTFKKHGKSWYRLRMTGPIPLNDLVFNLWLDIPSTKAEFNISGVMRPCEKPEIIKHYCLTHVQEIKTAIVKSL